MNSKTFLYCVVLLSGFFSTHHASDQAKISSKKKDDLKKSQEKEQHLRVDPRLTKEGTVRTRVTISGALDTYIQERIREARTTFLDIRSLFRMDTDELFEQTNYFRDDAFNLGKHNVMVLKVEFGYRGSGVLEKPFSGVPVKLSLAVPTFLREAFVKIMAKMGLGIFLRPDAAGEFFLKVLSLVVGYKNKQIALGEVRAELIRLFVRVRHTKGYKDFNEVFSQIAPFLQGVLNAVLIKGKKCSEYMKQGWESLEEGYDFDFDGYKISDLQAKNLKEIHRFLNAVVVHAVLEQVRMEEEFIKSDEGKELFENVMQAEDPQERREMQASLTRAMPNRSQISTKAQERVNKLRDAFAKGREKTKGDVVIAQYGALVDDILRARGLRWKELVPQELREYVDDEEFDEDEFDLEEEDEFGISDEEEIEQEDELLPEEEPLEDVLESVEEEVKESDKDEIEQGEEPVEEKDETEDIVELVEEEEHVREEIKKEAEEPKREKELVPKKREKEREETKGNIDRPQQEEKFIEDVQEKKEVIKKDLDEGEVVLGGWEEEDVPFTDEPPENWVED